MPSAWRSDPDIEGPRRSAETGQHSPRGEGWLSAAGSLAGTPGTRRLRPAERRGKKVEGKEPFLSKTQEGTFAGGEQRETGPARVEGAGGAGGGWARRRS